MMTMRMTLEASALRLRSTGAQVRRTTASSSTVITTTTTMTATTAWKSWAKATAALYLAATELSEAVAPARAAGAAR